MNTDGITVCKPGDEPPPLGKPSYRPIDATSRAGAERLHREQRRQLSQQQIETLLRRYFNRPHRPGL